MRAYQIVGIGIVICIAAGWVPACTEVSLQGLPPPPPQEVDNKLALTGDVCTKSPEDLVFPVRVLLLVDCSESMEVNDPIDPDTGETGKERAVRETVETLLTGEGDVKVSIVRFSSQAQPITAEQQVDDQVYTSYFSDNLDFVLSQIPLLRETDRTTNYLRALSEAYAEIRFELTQNAEQESLALSTYHVIMITDGIPDDDGTETRENNRDNILDSVKAIMELGRVFHVGKITVNTGLIETGSAVVDLAAEELLKAMAEEGGGAYRSFASGGELNFVYVDLTALKRVFTVNTLVAENLNAKVEGDLVLPDSDGDGVSDILEIETASNPYDPDSDGDGCRDGVEYRFKTSGLDPIDPGDCPCFLPDACADENENGICDCRPDADGNPVPEGACCTDADGDGLCDCIDEDANGLCDPSNYTDSDGDGLHDCEELYSGTNRSGADSDGDGLVDYLEVRFGTSPDIYDIEDDLDWDAVSNGIEVKTATDPNADSMGRSKQAYRYKIEEAETVQKGRTCYTFEVSNISLTEVMPKDDTVDFELGPAGQGYSGQNRVLVYVGEVPFDDPESYARYRVACVEAFFRYDGNYKNPPGGRVTLHDADFVELPDFVAEDNCIPPGGRRR